MIVLEHLSKFYRLVCGINDFDLSLAPGAYGLVGPNGSGKTTLIHLLTGNLRPSLGRVRVFGGDPRRDREVRRRIGLCPATDLLLPNATGYQWVHYLAKLSGLSSAVARQRTEACLTRLKMQEAMHQPIGSYSLGMRQRVKLAQAMVHDPELLILDEPFNGLDPIARHEFSCLLREFRAAGKSLLIASHVLHELESVTDSFLLIHGGRLLASGPAREVPTMLRDVPQLFQLNGVGLRHLAGQLAEFPWVHELKLVDDRQILEVGVLDVEAFQRTLTVLADQSEIEIHQVKPPSGNLASAFEALVLQQKGWS
jgi:ABC-2 type transport system ATP-binding protein